MPVYPYAAVTSAAAKQHRVLTVCAAHPNAEAPADVRWREQDGRWLIEGERGGAAFRVELAEQSDQLAPAVSVMV